MRRLRKVPYIYILKLFSSDWDCSRTLLTDAEDYVRVANSEGKNQLSFTSDGSILQTAYVFFSCSIQKLPIVYFQSHRLPSIFNYIWRQGSSHNRRMWRQTWGLPRRECTIFSNYSHYKRQSCIITLKDRFPCFPLALCVNLMIL